jgi:hypothetical protein
MKNPMTLKLELFRQQVGWMLRRPPEYQSREEREWLPWAERRVHDLSESIAAATVSTVVLSTPVAAGWDSLPYLPPLGREGRAVGPQPPPLAGGLS